MRVFSTRLGQHSNFNLSQSCKWFVTNYSDSDSDFSVTQKYNVFEQLRFSELYFFELMWCSKLACSLFYTHHRQINKRKHESSLNVMFFFCLIFKHIYMDHAWIGAKQRHFTIQDLPYLRVVFFYYTFQPPAQQIVSLLSHELTFFTNPSFVAGKFFFGHGLSCLPYFGLLWTKKCQNMERKWFYQK